MKAQNPDIEIWAVEPENAAILAGGTVGTHLQMGIGDGVIPPILNKQIYDHIYVVTDEEAIQTAKDLARAGRTDVRDFQWHQCCGSFGNWQKNLAKAKPL